MDAEYTVRRLINDHTIKLNHRVSLVRYVDHEQCEPFDPHLLSSPATRGRIQEGVATEWNLWNDWNGEARSSLYLRREQLVGSHDAWRQTLFVDILTDGL